MPQNRFSREKRRNNSSRILDNTIEYTLQKYLMIELFFLTFTRGFILSWFTVCFI